MEIIENLGVGIVTSPFLLKSGITPLSDIINVVASLCNRLYVITGNEEMVPQLPKHDNLQIYMIERRVKTHGFLKALKYAHANLKISFRIVRLSSKTSVWFFYLGEKPLLIPLLIARLLGKKTVFIASSTLVNVKEEQSPFLPTRLLVGLLIKIDHITADKIVISSQRNISEKDLNRYKGKILIACRHYVNLNKYNKQTPVDERVDLVGFIGRLSQEKGVMNFIESITKVLETRVETSFLIGGDGPLRPNVERYLTSNNLNDKAKYIGWIPKDEIQDYLGKLKLLVIPSYTETGPNIAFEAIACGTPVLATSVGLIPDVIKDGETGFMLKDNSSNCIAANIIRALEHPNLEKIVQNSRALVEKEFSYEKAVESYIRLFSSLNIGIRKAQSDNH